MAISPLGPLRATFKRATKLIKIENVIFVSYIPLSPRDYVSSSQLCLLALYIALFENKRGRNAYFQKSLKYPGNRVIKTHCAKNQVCKSIGVTCNTHRKFTKDKEEYYSKMGEKWPTNGQKLKFTKTKKCVFFSYHKDYYAKK